MNFSVKNFFSFNQTDFLNIKNDGKIVLYGAGQMGVDASDILKESGVDVAFFADKNPNIIDQKVNDILVRHPESFTQEEKDNYIFAISVITVSYNIIFNYLKDLGCKNTCFVGDLVNTLSKNSTISRTWRFENITDAEVVKLQKIYDNLTDEDSKKSLIQYLDWAYNNIERENFAPIRKMNDKYFIPEVLSALNNDETIVSYDFLSTTPVEDINNFIISLKKLYVIEPTKEKFRQLEEKYKYNKNVILQNFGLSSEEELKNYNHGLGLSVKSRFVDFETPVKYPVKKLDDLMNDISYSYLKVYGLGLAKEVIDGAIASIKKNRPIVSVTIHHTKKDFIEIPNDLIDNLDNYSFYLRLHSYCGFETLFYAIPKEKEKI